MKSFKVGNIEYASLTKFEEELNVKQYMQAKPIIIDSIMPFVMTIDKIKQAAPDSKGVADFVSIKGIFDIEKTDILFKVVNILIGRDIDDNQVMELKFKEFDELVTNLEGEIIGLVNFFIKQIGYNMTKFFGMSVELPTVIEKQKKVYSTSTKKKS